MFAIPFAINLGSVAVILRQCGFASCNQRAHGPPMFAIPTADVCRSLQVPAPSATAKAKMPSFTGAIPSEVAPSKICTVAPKAPVTVPDRTTALLLSVALVSAARMACAAERNRKAA